MAIIDSREPAPWYKRLGWLVVIWLGSVVALGVVAGGIADVDACGRHE